MKLNFDIKIKYFIFITAYLFRMSLQCLMNDYNHTLAFFILLFYNSSYANIISYPNTEYQVSMLIIKLMLFLILMGFSARHSDAAKRITSCTTCDNKSRQKSSKPTLDIKIKGGITHTHIEYQILITISHCKKKDVGLSNHFMN